MRNLAAAVIERERIITTVEKAKEARRFVEKLITLAKKGTLHARRLAVVRLGPMAATAILDDKGEPTGQSILQKLFSDLGPRFEDRPGGYMRIVKRHERRLGDAGRTAILELLKAGETKVRAKAPAPPPAPRIETPPAPAEAPAEEQATPSSESQPSANPSEQASSE